MARFEQCATAWATQTGKHRRASSMSYDKTGGAVRSHGTIIGQIHATTKGQVAFITTDKWSDSTSRATNLARAAAETAGMAVFNVPRLGLGLDNHAANIEHYRALAQEKLVGASKARSPEGAERWANRAREVLREAKLYAETFDLGIAEGVEIIGTVDKKGLAEIANSR